MFKFKNKHAGSDIYVIGSGKSLDYIDPSFFENKIVVGVNQTYKRIKPSYIVRKELSLLGDAIKDNPDVIHFIAVPTQGIAPQIENVVLFDHLKNNLRELIYPDDPEKIVVSYSTITSAIHISAYMGAKNIILVGHDCGLLDGQSNFKGYHTSHSLGIIWKDKPQRRYNSWVSSIEKDTIRLKKILKEKYGCNVYSLNPFINFNLEGHTYKKV